MKRKLIFLSMLLVLCLPVIVYAQDNESIDELRENVRNKLEELSEASAMLRDAYSDRAMKLGDPIVFEDSKVIILESVEEVEVQDYDAQGTVYKVDLRIGNHSSEALSMSKDDFNLYDGNLSLSEYLPYGNFLPRIDSGMNASGSIYFDVLSEGLLMLIVDNNSWSINTDGLEKGSIEVIDFDDDENSVSLARAFEMAEFARTNCAACHGQSFSGGMGPNLIGYNENLVIDAVREGPGSMPSYSTDQISDEDLEALARFFNEL